MQPCNCNVHVPLASRRAGPACRSSRSAGTRRLRFDKAAADRVPRERDAVVHAELLQDVRPVTLDGLLADYQPVGDLLGAEALGDQLHHLLLTGGERLLTHGLIGPRALQIVPDQGGHRPGYRNGSPRIAARHASTRSRSTTVLSTYPEAPALSAS